MQKLSASQLLYRLMTNYGPLSTYRDTTTTCEAIRAIIVGLALLTAITLLGTAVVGGVIAGPLAWIFHWDINAVPSYVAFGIQLGQGIWVVIAATTLILSTNKLYKRYFKSNKRTQYAPSYASQVIVDCWESIHNKVCIQIDLNKLKND